MTELELVNVRLLGKLVSVLHHGAATPLIELVENAREAPALLLPFREHFQLRALLFDSGKPHTDESQGSLLGPGRTQQWLDEWIEWRLQIRRLF
jgi:hypothetical protein